MRTKQKKYSRAVKKEFMARIKSALVKLPLTDNGPHPIEWGCELRLTTKQRRALHALIQRMKGAA